MSKDEFFAFMPLLIYGIAVSELMIHWRDYLKSGRRYWPHLIFGILLLELAFSNFYFLYDVLDQLFVNYLNFLARLTPPLVFLLLVSVYTPEENVDVKTYFNDKMRTIFLLLSFFIFLNMIMEIGWNELTYIRASAIFMCLLVAWFNSKPIFWIFIAFRALLFIFYQILPILIK